MRIQKVARDKKRKEAIKEGRKKGRKGRKEEMQTRKIKEEMSNHLTLKSSQTASERPQLSAPLGG